MSCYNKWVFAKRQSTCCEVWVCLLHASAKACGGYSVLSPGFSSSLALRQTLPMNLKLNNSIRLTTDQSVWESCLRFSFPYMKTRIIVMYYPKFQGEQSSDPPAYKAGTLLTDPSTQPQSVHFSILNSTLHLNSRGRTRRPWGGSGELPLTQLSRKVPSQV